MQRSYHLSIYVFLIGLLCLSFSYNVSLYMENCLLNKEINSYNWISGNELDIIEKEISRLENSKYNITK